MKHINILIAASIALLVSASCNEPYDPIGPNRPSPVLLLSQLNFGFEAAGGECSATISTNAEEVTVDRTPDWVSATINEDNTGVTFVAAPNTTDKVRTGVVTLTCASGDNMASQYVKFAQGRKGEKFLYVPFAGKTLPNEMTCDDETLPHLATGNGYVSITAEGDPGYLYSTKLLLDNEKAFSATVDVKMNGGEGGAKLYRVNGDQLGDIEIYFGDNASRDTGGIWGKQGETWCAMDDGTIGGLAGKVGSGAIPGNQTEEVFKIPAADDRDDWWRLSITHEARSCDYIVGIYTLKTFLGETSPYLCHYARKFEALANCSNQKGSFSLWGRNFETQFKNLMISYQE
ncbi:MAG: BACON domain-containing protein [Bacteroidales bacterium]|nr:BACON domain-containing protein [Bacteroidales bacterium]